MSTLDEKLALANAKVPNVYDAGKSCKDMTDFSYFCYFGARLDTLSCLNTRCGTDFHGMFEGCGDLTAIPQLDLSNGTNFDFMFDACTSLTTIPMLDVSNGTNFAFMFSDCSSLTTIPMLDVSNGVDLSDMFTGCSSLTNVSFTGVIPVSISFYGSSKLTADSLQSIVNALKVVTSGTKPKLTLHSNSWTTLEATTPPTGSNTWKEYITNVKGWTYA